jgi:acyl carrier protein
MSDQRSQILETMKKVICDQLDVEASAVTEKAAFVDDLGADSLALVELVLAFEEKFGVTIPDTDADKLVTVGDAIKYVIDHGGKARGESVSAA